MAALWCGGLDEIINQLEDIFFISQIAEWVIPVRLLQVDQVEHPDVIPFAFQPPSGGCEHLHFRVGNDIIGVGLQNVWLDIAAGLSRAAAANNQDVEGAAVLVGVQAQADMAGQDLVLFWRNMALTCRGEPQAAEPCSSPSRVRRCSEA